VCIQVAAADSLYVTDDFLVTHSSTCSTPTGSMATSSAT
jgi:hypothetical protein